MLDSGCGHDLIAEADVASAAYPTDRSGPATVFQTASGRDESRVHATICIDEIDEHVRAFVLPSTPAALSIGRRCLREGLSFVWKASPPLYLMRPDGMIVSLEVYEDTPRLSPTRTRVARAPSRRNRVAA